MKELTRGTINRWLDEFAGVFALVDPEMLCGG
jgi:hypothetical protein